YSDANRVPSMKAWIFQDPKQVKKVGAANASWYVGFVDPDGRRRCQSCGPGPAGSKAAEKLRDKIAAELLTRTYNDPSRRTWSDFRSDYENKILAGLAERTRDAARTSLGHFERIAKPKRVSAISARTIADFIANRRREPG